MPGCGSAQNDAEAASAAGGGSGCARWPKERPRWGFRRAGAVLRDEGWKVNRKQGTVNTPFRDDRNSNYSSLPSQGWVQFRVAFTPPATVGLTQT